MGDVSERSPGSLNTWFIASKC